ncbi:MAG: hypothetical protein ABJA90_06855 [Ginsengibacter sp.]
MKRKSIKTIFFLFITLTVVAAIAGYLLWNKPHTDVRETKGIETNAIALYKSFVTDSVTAKTTFVNKVLKITGIIKSVSENQQHQQVILLKTSEPEASVNCTMESKAIAVSVGDKVSLKGICIGYIGGAADMGLPGDVFLVRCYPSI